MITANEPVIASSDPGSSLYSAVENAKLVAMALHTIVHLTHNGMEMKVYPSSNIQVVMDNYHRKRERENAEEN